MWPSKQEFGRLN
uniref:Uncharacterized protein n=1 Tax=Timema monikensis TaxID=170555 RepID=A0A7R9HV13_9NEOP|nr:unnamed protein product [Timema monikensis]